MKDNFGLYLILTCPVAGYAACAQAAVDLGVRYLQLRMKDAPRASALETAHTIRAITHDTATKFIVNDDLAVAIESDADGLHLGQDDSSLTEARKKWNRPDKVFGLSTHSHEQATRALDSSPDYIGVGPVFPTQTKILADPTLGIEKAGQIMDGSPLTSVAIGGINEENLPTLLEGGVHNFCVIHAVNKVTDPAAAIGRLQEIWEKHYF